MNASVNNPLFGEIFEDSTTLTVDDLCRLCAVERTHIVELVEEGVLSVIGVESVEWQFPGSSLRRARMALRLQQDLQLNLAGVALALELLEEIARLRATISVGL